MSYPTPGLRSPTDQADHPGPPDHKLTQDAALNSGQDHPPESLCPETQTDSSSLEDRQDGTRPVLHILPTVGRATTHYPRARTELVVEQLPPEEQELRSQRTREANDRRAVRRAADHAMESVCTVLLVGILNEQDDGGCAVEEAQRFGHRLSDAQLALTGLRCRYVGVVVRRGLLFELHMLVSSDVSVELASQCWQGSHDLSIGSIDRDEIEGAVFDLAELDGGERLGSHRFIRTRGPRPQVETVEVSGIDDAREALRERIAPQEPRLVSAQPFGRNPRATFRFTPIK